MIIRRKNYDFKLFPVQAESLRFVKNYENEVYMQRNVNKIFLFEILSRVKYANIIVSVTGLPGTGKSYFSMALGEWIALMSRSKFDISNICFSVAELVDRLKTLQNGETLVLDEANVRTEYGVGSFKPFQQLELAEQTLRKSQINFIFNSPRIGEYHIHNFVLETFGIDRKKGVSRCLLFDDKENLIGYITVRKPSDKIIDEYEKKKDTFLDKVRQMQTGSKAHLEKIAKEYFDRKDFAGATQSERLTIIQVEHPDMLTTECEAIRNIAVLHLKKMGLVKKKKGEDDGN